MMSFLKLDYTINKYTDKLNDIIDDLRAKIEEETKIRKLFENKLNDLHSIVRDKEAGYSRAQIDLDHLLQENIEKDKLLEQLRQWYKDSEQVKMAYQIKFETTNHLLTNTKKELEFEKVSHLRDVSKLKSEYESLRKNNDRNERDLAELRKLYEDKVLNNKFLFLDYWIQLHRNKFWERKNKETERLNKLLEKWKDTELLENKIKGLSKECQELTRDLVGAKEREIGFKKRCEEIRQEYGDNDKEFIELKTKYSALQARCNEVEHNYNEKCKKFEDQGEALLKIERNRKELTESNMHLTINLKHEKEESKKKDRMLTIERDNFIRIRQRLIQLENDYDNLNTKQNATREILQVENYELKHKISILEEKLSIFKNSRNHWIKNIETEWMTHDETRHQLHQMKLRLADEITEK